MSVFLEVLGEMAMVILCIITLLAGILVIVSFIEKLMDRH